MNEILAAVSPDFIAELVTNVLKLVMIIAGGVFTYILVPFAKNTVIPWLKEKHLYDIVKKFVQAAEKMGESGIIDKQTKKQFVIDMLKSKGVNVTPEVEALIESAVEELDEFKFFVDELEDAEE